MRDKENSGKKVEKKAKRLDGGAKMEARESDVSAVPRMVVPEKLSSVEERLD